MIEIHDVIKIQNLDKDNNSAKDYVAATSFQRIIAVIIVLLLMHFFNDSSILAMFLDADTWTVYW
ncbi:hypothetical protein BGI03_00450 [Snodgrassella alvi]|nr:hypothetical protein BGH98_02460 [Snodgrassella alvi]ORF15445.1 hypothetical protein BGI01_02190 [Snodgrassella alvi]ORF22261.1 hypothetical protein BGI03_00450 [Snodgrassella alvi]ORF22927.1 hypothetical protein BGI04_00035 [Snodgrassella alvi]